MKALMPSTRRARKGRRLVRPKQDAGKIENFVYVFGLGENPTHARFVSFLFQGAILERSKRDDRGFWSDVL